MNTAGRPTLRCLAEDLPNDWENAQASAAASAGVDCQIPLAELAHPIIRKAAGDFPGDATDSQHARESISGLSNPVWWKVKIGARWRGAVWEDPNTGQAWLCAAGYRREGEATDFYKQFMADVASYGPRHFLPTDADRDRLDRELRVAEIDRWGTRIQAETRQLLDQAWSGTSASTVVSHPRNDEHELVELVIEVDRLQVEDEDLLGVTVTVRCLDYAEYQLVSWVEIVCLAAIDPREQRWGSVPVAGVPTHSQDLFGEEIEAFREQATRDLLPGEMVPGEAAHYAHQPGLMEKTVEGEGVKALCGAWFVPRQDHGAMEKCTSCAAIYRALPAD